MFGSTNILFKLKIKFRSKNNNITFFVMSVGNCRLLKRYLVFEKKINILKYFLLLAVPVIKNKEMTFRTGIHSVPVSNSVRRSVAELFEFL